MPAHSGCSRTELDGLLAEAKERLAVVVAERDDRIRIRGRGNRADAELLAALVSQRKDEAIWWERAGEAPDWATDLATEDLFSEKLTVRFRANMIRSTNLYPILTGPGAKAHDQCI
jgi:hypothetical protein